VDRNSNSSNNSVAPNASGGVPAAVAQDYQPTVRVMRLYKPGFHFAPAYPQVEFDKAGINKFPLSPYLLLPDSFGDIYAGENFAAYIAIVNGYPNMSFHNVSLSVRLQTSSMVTDLIDCADQLMTSPSNPQSRVMSANDKLDMIVKHSLNEFGTHTLRVSVNYHLTPQSETKTLRKFYRFNVLQPLLVTSHFVDVNGHFMIQCNVTNITKSPIFIDEVTFISSIKQYNLLDVVKKVRNPPTKQTDGVSSLTTPTHLPMMMHLLQPDESHAFSFVLSPCSPQDVTNMPRSVGCPQVRWCTNMGEFSLYKGEETLLKLPLPSANPNPILLRIAVSHCPAVCPVGVEFPLTLQVTNPSSQTLSLQLSCSSPSSASLVLVGLSSCHLGTIEPGDSLEVVLAVFAATAGLQPVRGLCLRDILKKGVVVFSPETVICHVFVAAETHTGTPPDPNTSPTIPPSPPESSSLLSSSSSQVELMSIPVNSSYPNPIPVQEPYHLTPERDSDVKNENNNNEEVEDEGGLLEDDMDEVQAEGLLDPHQPPPEPRLPLETAEEAEEQIQKESFEEQQEEEEEGEALHEEEEEDDDNDTE